MASLRRQINDLAVTRFARSHDINPRLTDPALWHVTLAFLGDLPDAARASDALDRASAVASPCVLRLGGAGTFGRGRFTTAWIGVQGDGLDAIARAVRAQLRRAKVPFDRKPFRAHLTIGRPGDRVPRDVLAEDLATLAAYAGPAWKVKELCLVESHMGPKPTHEVWHRAPLNS